MPCPYLHRRGLGAGQGGRERDAACLQDPQRDRDHDVVSGD